MLLVDTRCTRKKNEEKENFLAQIKAKRNETKMLSSLAAAPPATAADTCLSLLFIQSSFYIQRQRGERERWRDRDRELGSVCDGLGYGGLFAGLLIAGIPMTWPPGRLISQGAREREEKKKIHPQLELEMNLESRWESCVVGVHFACNSLDCRQNTFAYFFVPPHSLSVFLSLSLSLTACLTATSPALCRLWATIIRQHLPMSRETWVPFPTWREKGGEGRLLSRDLALTSQNEARWER